MMISNNTSAENNAILTLILSHQKKSSKHYIDLAQSKQAKIHEFSGEFSFEEILEIFGKMVKIVLM